MGDTHGNFSVLLAKIKQYDLRDAWLISVGDIGIGFLHPMKQRRVLNDLNTAFKNRNIFFMGIRGNHDDPAYFDGNTQFSNLELLPDYTARNLNGEDFLFVGGAISIDRQCRVLGQSYWLDETFVLKPELTTPCDVLVAHSAPYWLGPFDKQGIEGWCQKDLTLWDECYKERIEIDQLIQLCGAKRSYHGHFHQSAWSDHRECYSSILDINEIANHRKSENLTAL